MPRNLYLSWDDPENYWGQFMRRLAERYPLVVHTSSLSLGTPGPLDQSELERFDAV